MISRCATACARVGHDVTVFEKNDRIGGLLRYGIPDFKMEKSHIDRRVAQMASGSVVFRSVVVGELGDAAVTNWASETVEPKQLLADFDAVILAGAPSSRAICRCRAELDGVRTRWIFCRSRTRSSPVMWSAIKLSRPANM